ncbi:MAG: hypothetical protein Q8M26_00850 [Pseudolabrys sp.]|nr:hypothetical protein [Pseudolabrys sp.]
MTGKHRTHSKHPAHHPHDADAGPHRRGRRHPALRRGVFDFLRRPLIRRLIWATGFSVVLASIAAAGLWWRLSSGPIDLDMATPWLKSAIEENFGGTHTVVVGGTQLERDDNGRTSLRMRDIVVRDPDGTVVASAPKAEVGISVLGLLGGRMRAQSLNLVGAEMSVRIESDGQVTVFAGADKRPIATATPIAPTRPLESVDPVTPQTKLREGLDNVAGVLTWLDGVGASGLDGHELQELGLKNGSLTVDDQRNGKRWTFDRINVTLTRPTTGGVIFRIESDNPERLWQLSAAMRPLSGGIRAIGIEARKLATRDILLALRLDDGALDVDLPLSATVRAEILPDGTPQVVHGHLIAETGAVINRSNESASIPIDGADIRFNWDSRRRSLVMPFQIKSAGNQFTLQATVDAPADQGGEWRLSMVRGDPVIDPIILASGGAESFAFNRVALAARIDLEKKRVSLDQADFNRVDTRPRYNLGIAVSGSLDYSGTEPNLAFGVAATRMPMSVLKRAWPVFVASGVRSWVEANMSDGMVERVVIAGNAPLPQYSDNGPPMADDGLSVDIETSGTTLQPVERLPAIRDADLTVRVTGRTAAINLGRGTVEVAPGRKLSIASGVFSIADTHLTPTPATATFRIDGTMPAAATLLASDALRGTVALALDPDATRGTIAAQTTVNMLLGKTAPDDSVTYGITADLTNFAADNMLLGQKVEASSLRVIAGGGGYQVKGDVKLNGMPASIDLHKQKNAANAELRLTASIDEAARKRLGLDFGTAVTGTIPIKVNGIVGAGNKDDRMNVDADLTPVKIDNLLPGWVKPAGRAARATYTMIKSGKSMRFDDMNVEGGGVSVKGSVEFDADNEIAAANFPVFSLSDGDKGSVKADRTSDGALRVTMRGDVYDGRNFIKASLAGGGADKAKQKQAASTDLELDVRIGTVAGHGGETLRGLDLKLSRRNGRIRSFSLASKIGRGTALNGDMRVRARDNKPVVYFETDDAGSLLRFTDMYPRMFGGQIWVAMDPPSQDPAPQIGTLFLRNFSVRGEPALDRVVSGAPGAGQGVVEFTEFRADFTRIAGRMAVRDGVVRGPLVGATIEGNIDYVRDDVHLRGTFVPFYGLNNMFGQIPILGLFLGGGSNEGLLGITYEAVGPPNAPRISVNPVTAIAPGLLRKFIPSPGTFDRNFIPTR